MRVSQITSSDERMDIKDIHTMLDTPVNQYSIKCNECAFPDIDKVPQPYYLMRKRIYSGVEIFKADLGNLLVSARIKAVIEQLFPNQCTFYKTYIEGENIPTKWWLGVINNEVISGETKDEIPRCKSCNEPLCSHPGTQYKYWYHDMEVDYDIVKSKNWHSFSTISRTNDWVFRDIFLSVRFIGLLKKLKAKGIYQYLYCKYKKLLPEETKWIEDSFLSLCEELKFPKSQHISLEDMQWLREKVCKHSTVLNKTGDFVATFKVKSNDLIETLCSIHNDILLDKEKGIKIVPSESWELNIGLSTKKNKLISFCFDDYGNSWAFDAKDKNLAVYYYNHEYGEHGEYDVVHSSIIDFLKTYWN